MTETTETTNPEPARRAYSALTYEPENFRGFVNDMGLSLSQQDALLEDIWLIVVGVIDAAFGPRQFPDPRINTKPLVADSDAVLRSIINSKSKRTRDAQVE